MKSLNKTIRSDDVQVEIFVDNSDMDLQVDMNCWFKENSVEIISIDYTIDSGYVRAFVLYR